MIAAAKRITWADIGAALCCTAAAILVPLILSVLQ
jgi:hypothetical protein